jgi:hypothetical protein
MIGGKAMADVTRIFEGNRWRRWRIALWGGAAALLSLPAFAMAAGAPGVVWTASDFIAMGVLLGLACGLAELVARGSSNGAYRVAGLAAVAMGFLTIWVNLAVGMIGSDDNPYNAMFLGVLGLALAGSVIARFQAPGMAGAMVAAAVAQAVLGAMGISEDQRGGLLSMLFAIPWLVSAALFRKAARDDGARIQSGAG